MKKILLSLVFISLHFSSFGQSNEGTAFWCGFMEHVDRGDNNKVVMITSKTSASGTISVPGRNWERSFSIAPNEVELITMPSFTESIGSESIDNNAIFVASNVPVSVYMHQYQGFRSDASLVLPIESIGREYYVLAYQGINNRGEDYPSEFLIVATEDDTQFSITPAVSTRGGRAAGNDFIISLNKGETYQVQGRGVEDLSGSYVKGDKPFALFAGSSWTQVPTSCPTRDNLLEQMYAIGTYGRQFVAVPNRHMPYDVYRVIAAEDATTLSVDNGINNQEYQLDAGDWVEFNLSRAASITGNKPIQVAQYIIGQNCSGHSAGDPSMMLLNSVEQTRQTVTLYNSSLQNIQQNFINIICRTVDAPFVTLDGQALADLGVNFTAVSANEDLSYAQVSVSSGAHTIISEGCGVIVSAYGYGDAESYAYSGGASFRSLNEVPIPDGACFTDTLLFDSGLSAQRYEVEWDFGDGARARGVKVRHKYAAVGFYNVRVRLYDQCLDLSSENEKQINITLRQALALNPDQEVCAEEQVLMTATSLEGPSQYVWKGPNNYSSQDQNPILENVRPIETGTYEAIGIVDGCMTFPAYTNLTVHPLPQPDLGQDYLVCDEDEDFSRTISLNDVFFAYEWSTGENSSSIVVDKSGVYSVKVIDENACTQTDSIHLIQKCPTRVYVPSAFSPNGDGINDEFRVFAQDLEALHLMVFDRWGNLLFETKEIEGAWDGTINGEAINTGVYFWKAEIKGSRRNDRPFVDIITGTVNLIR